MRRRATSARRLKRSPRLLNSPARLQTGATPDNQGQRERERGHDGGPRHLHDERLALGHLTDRLDDGGVRRRRGDDGRRDGRNGRQDNLRFQSRANRQSSSLFAFQTPPPSRARRPSEPDERASARAALLSSDRLSPVIRTPTPRARPRARADRADPPHTPPNHSRAPTRAAKPLARPSRARRTRARPAIEGSTRPRSRRPPARARAPPSLLPRDPNAPKFTSHTPTAHPPPHAHGARASLADRRARSPRDRPRASPRVVAPRVAPSSPRPAPRERRPRGRSSRSSSTRARRRGSRARRWTTTRT